MAVFSVICDGLVTVIVMNGIVLSSECIVNVIPSGSESPVDQVSQFLDLIHGKSKMISGIRSGLYEHDSHNRGELLGSRMIEDVFHVQKFEIIVRVLDLLNGTEDPGNVFRSICQSGCYVFSFFHFFCKYGKQIDPFIRSNGRSSFREMFDHALAIHSPVSDANSISFISHNGPGIFHILYRIIRIKGLVYGQVFRFDIIFQDRMICLVECVKNRLFARYQWLQVVRQHLRILLPLPYHSLQAAVPG